MATKSTTFSEYDRESENKSNLTINIYFSAQNQTTWFQTAWLSCTCNGQTQGANVSHPKGGSTWASFTFYDIDHNEDGTKSVSWSWSCATGTQVLGTISDSGVYNLHSFNRYPKLNYGSDFTDDTNPVYNITSYNTFPVRIKIEADGDAQFIVRDIPKDTNGNYTLELTDEERRRLRSVTPSTNILPVLETACAMDGETELSVDYKSYVMTIDISGRIRINNEWIKATPYVRTNGEWKKAIPYIRVNNEWKRGR